MSEKLSDADLDDLVKSARRQLATAISSVRAASAASAASSTESGLQVTSSSRVRFVVNNLNITLPRWGDFDIHRIRRLMSRWPRLDFYVNVTQLATRSHGAETMSSLCEWLIDLISQRARVWADFTLTSISTPVLSGRLVLNMGGPGTLIAMYGPPTSRRTPSRRTPNPTESNSSSPPTDTYWIHVYVDHQDLPESENVLAFAVSPRPDRALKTLIQITKQTEYLLRGGSMPEPIPLHQCPHTGSCHSCAHAQWLREIGFYSLAARPILTPLRDGDTGEVAFVFKTVNMALSAIATDGERYWWLKPLQMVGESDGTGLLVAVPPSRSHWLCRHHTEFVAKLAKQLRTPNG